MIQRTHQQHSSTSRQCAEAKRLTVWASLADTGQAPEKEGAGFGDPNNESAHTAQCGFFSCVLTFVRPQGAAVAGIPSGMPVSFRAGSPTLPFAAHPFGDGRGSTATKEYHTMFSTMQPLADLAARNLQPSRREIWIGIGFKPPKRCAIAIDPARLPTDTDCWPVAGLDVFVLFHGHVTRYGVLRGVCGALYQARPRRLMVVDVDIKRYAFLKMAVA